MGCTQVRGETAIANDAARADRTLLQYAAELGHPGMILALLQARVSANAHDSACETPIDHAEYWATRAPARAAQCLACATLIRAFNGFRARPTSLADPATTAATRRRLEEAAASRGATIPWLDEPFASFFAPSSTRQPPCDAPRSIANLPAPPPLPVVTPTLAAPSVAPVTGILECARRSDGGAALLLASTRFLVAHGLQNKTCPVVISGAEASGPLFPPEDISESALPLRAIYEF
jgi:hypothetical protein